MSLEIQTAAKLAIVLAQDNAHRSSSARVALWDAASLYNDENYLYAFHRAITSIEHSVGIKSKTWYQAKRAIMYPVDAAEELERIKSHK